MKRIWFAAFLIVPQLCTAMCHGQAVISFGGIRSGQDESADYDGPVDGRVIGKVWHTRVPFHESFQYLNQLREELEMPQSPLIMMMPAKMALGPGALKKPVDDSAPEMKGTLFFLQTVPVPSLNNPISFELIGDQADFAKRMLAQKNAMGAASELIGGDDRYEVKLNFGKMIAAAAPPDGSDKGGADGEGKPQVRSFAITIQADVGSGDPDSKSAPPNFKPRQSISTFYRYVDGIMYSSSTSALHKIELPNRKSLLLNEEEATNDLYADFDFREIPIELKRAFWTTLEATASTWLQKFDNEATGDYSFRRAIGEGRLELLKAALFDIDRLRFSLNLSTDGVAPIVSKLKVTARENSPFALALEVLGRSSSQLDVLRDDSSPLVVSSTVNLPEWSKPFAVGFVDSLRLKLREAAGGDDGAGVLIDDVMLPVQASVAAGQFDSAVCLRGDTKTGLVLAAGVRMVDAERFLPSLESLLLVNAADQRLHVSRSRIDDYTVVTMRADSVPIPRTQTESSAPEMPLNVHLAATGSWLWITVGGLGASATDDDPDRALSVLTELVQGSHANLSRQGEAIPLMVRFRLDQWLGETPDGLSRVPQMLLTELERWVSKETTPQKMVMSINGAKVEQAKPEAAKFTSFAAKVFRPESSELDLRVRTASRELVVDATVGIGIIKFFAAQYLDSQNRMFSGMPMQFKMTPGAGGGKGVQTIRIGR